MLKINKKIYIASIFMLIRVFLCQDFAFALRVPLASDPDLIDREAAETHGIDPGGRKRLEKKLPRNSGLTSFEDGQGVVLYGPDGIKAENVNKCPLQSNSRILVIERHAGQHMPFSGNTVSALEDSRLNNIVETITLEDDVHVLSRKLTEFAPDLVIAPLGDAEIKQALVEHGSGRSSGLLALHYDPLYKETELNCFHFYPEEVLDIKLRAQSSHETQNRRTEYIKIAELLSRYFAKLGGYLGYETPRGTVAADPLIVAEFKDGGLIAREGKYQIIVKGDPEVKGYKPLIVAPGDDVNFVSPHPDDIEISEGGLVYYLLSRGVNVHNIIMNLDKWGVILTAEERENLGNDADERRRELRKPEIELSRERFMEGLPKGHGELYIHILNLGISEQNPGSANEDIDAPQFSEDLEIVRELVKTVFSETDSGKKHFIFPDDRDSHPHHRIANSIFTRVLAEHSEKVIPSLYIAAWAGELDTFYLSQNNKDPEKIPQDLKNRIGIAELFKTALAYLVGELAGGFGSKSPTPEELGGVFAERFKRAYYPPESSITVPAKLPRQGV